MDIASEPSRRTSASATDAVSAAALSEAVAGMGLNSKCPSAESTAAEMIPPAESLGTDSGYVSLTSSPGFQPRENSEEDGYDLSLRKRFRRKTMKLKEFQQDLPETTVHRFMDLKDLFDQPLYRLRSENKGPPGTISMRLKVLGTDPASAKPWIVILCDKTLYRKVKHFFDQSSVKNEYQPRDVDSDLPSFGLLVYDKPPRPTAGTTYNAIYGQHQIYSPDFVTWCGTTIKCETCGEHAADSGTSAIRFATLGGIIKVVDAMQTTMLYGMTAGHVLFNDEIPDSEHDPVSSEDENEESQHLWDQQGEVFELEIDFEEDQGSSESWPLSQENKVVPWRQIGHVVLSSRDRDSIDTDLDWALLNVRDPAYYRPNLLVKDSDLVTDVSSQPPRLYHARSDLKPITVAGALDTESLQPRPVLLLGGVSGPTPGFLVPKSAFLMMGPGKSFIETYSLVLDDGSGKLV
jgi:hypothetical protein